MFSLPLQLPGRGDGKGNLNFPISSTDESSCVGLNDWRSKKAGPRISLVLLSMGSCRDAFTQVRLESECVSWRVLFGQAHKRASQPLAYGFSSAPGDF